MGYCFGMKFEERDGGSVTRVMFDGELEAVKKAVSAYLEDYPERDYMTRIIEESQTIDGLYHVEVWRLSGRD